LLFDPDTVTSIPIDPDRQLPPDLGGDPDKAIRMPLCPGCVTRASTHGGPPADRRSVGERPITAADHATGRSGQMATT
jgi:hypothetical protein